MNEEDFFAGKCDDAEDSSGNGDFAYGVYVFIFLSTVIALCI